MEDYNPPDLNPDPNPFERLTFPDLNGDGGFSPVLEECGVIVGKYDPGKSPEENLRRSFEENAPSTPAGRNPLRACFDGGRHGAQENYVAHARPFRKTVPVSGK